MRIIKGVIFTMAVASSFIPAPTHSSPISPFPKEIKISNHAPLTMKILSFQDDDTQKYMTEIKKTFLATWNEKWQDRESLKLGLFDKNKFLESQWMHITNKFQNQPNVKLVVVLQDTTPVFSYFIEHIKDPKGDSLYLTHLAIYGEKENFEHNFTSIIQELAKVTYKKMDVKYILTTILPTDPKMVETMDRLGFKPFKETSSPLRYRSFSSLKQQYPTGMYEFYGMIMS